MELNNILRFPPVLRFYEIQFISLRFGLAKMISLLLLFISPFSKYEVEMMNFIARLEMCDL